MRVIGTAGHVDHGKSALILALTGINPDRLREEIERQMTIDLGFAWMTLPDGEEIGFVDVPGHRDFIDNMLAGVGGIDAALFIVAADEGVMPQTKEHLAILDLLEVQDAIVVLTKIDLIEDEQWLDLVKEEVRELLKGTSLESADFASVSAITGDGLENLKEQITGVILKSASRPDIGKPRLSIDRVFTISGFGTVVTGTLLDGVLNVGDEVEILPKKLKARIRGLQSHKKKVETVYPGSRTAVNLTGIDVSSLKRGDIVAKPGTYSTTSMVDVQYRHLAEIGARLKHDQQVKMFVGAAQTMARVRVLGMEKIEPGEEGWLQLVLEESIVAVRGDHYILRRPSPGATLGGGRIADPHPKRRHRLKDIDVIQRLEKMHKGSPGEVLAQALIQLGPVKVKFAVEKAGLGNSDATDAISELIGKGELVQFEDGELTPDSEIYISHQIVKNKFEDGLFTIVSDFHKSQPLKFGILKEELRSRSKLDGLIYSLFINDLIRQGRVKDLGIKVAAATYDPTLNEEQKQVIDELLREFIQSPHSPPTVKESINAVGEDLFLFLIESDTLSRVSAEIIFKMDVYDKMVETIRSELADRGTLSVAEVRDLFNTSRKYALAFMEHLDSINITRREGDVRKLYE